MKISIKKVLAFLLTFIMILSGLVSCGNQEEGSKAPEGTKEPMQSESESESESTPVTSDLEDIKITVGDLSKYKIIVPYEFGQEIAFEVSYLFHSFKEKFAPEMLMSSDLIVPGLPMYSESVYEILISVCNREESVALAEELSYCDYVYKAVGTKLLICAISSDALCMAIKDFRENVMDVASADKGDVFFNNKEQAREYRHDYEAEGLVLDGTPIEEYTIVYPKSGTTNEKQVASMLREGIARYTGAYLEMTTDVALGESTGKEIHIGITNRDTELADGISLKGDDAFIGQNGENFVTFLGASGTELYLAANSFISWMKAQADVDNPTYDTTEKGVFAVKTSETISIMSYNIQMWAPTISGKPEATMQVIIDKAPDIFGIQEGTPAWMGILDARFGDEYVRVGIGRNGVDDTSATEDHENQYTAIFYKKDKFTLVEEGTKWLTRTPDVVSKVEGSYATRAFTYAILERKSDGVRFVVVNTHLDHEGGQDEQMYLLTRYAKAHFSDYPTVLMGDFNTHAGTDRYNTMINSGYASGKHVAETKINANVGTNPHGNEIDFCFGTIDAVCFEKYEVISDKTYNGETPSDHYALYIEFQICK